ncbi:MAG: ABC transporter permease [Geminicoccales bacterium]
MTRRSSALSPRRIGALVLRYWYLLLGSWPRFVELAYWPTVQMILWGFITQFFYTHSSWVMQAFGVLLAAVLLWDTLFRAEIGFSISFLEEMWSRNLAQLFVTPLRPYEFVFALMSMSLIRTLIGVVPAMLLAIPLYRFSIFDLGPSLIVFFANLMVTGWVVGLLVISLILRHGLGAESLAWLIVFALAPLSGVYYPIDTLPGWLQPVSWALPTSHVFEGMRAVLIENTFRADLLVNAAGLNLLYLAIATATFLRTFRVARERGLLLQIGE